MDPHRPKKDLIKRLLQASMNLLFPQRCPGCGRSGYAWCDLCQSQVLQVTERTCRSCGLSHLTEYCPAVSPHPIVVRSYAHYLPPLTKAILELKYRPNKALASIMSGWLHGLYIESGWGVDAVIPVPLAFVRKQQRGYNQVELIASPFAEALDLPLDRNALTRVRDTGSQVGLDHLARRSNLEGAFDANPHHCKDRSFLLIDDLLTSGATIAACSQALYAAGAGAVFGLTVARADRKIHQRGMALPKGASDAS